MTGGDPHLAEDLVQKCVIRLYVAWPRVRSMHLDSYVRRSLVNALIDERRGAFWRHERSLGRASRRGRVRGRRRGGKAETKAAN